MFTIEQRDAIRAAIDEEYRKDCEALERVMRWATVAGVFPKGGEPPLGFSNSNPATLIDNIRMIMRESASRTWSAQTLVAEMKKRGVEMKSRNPVQTVSVTLKKLSDRGQISLIKPGVGREPHFYQWITLKTTSITKEDEGEDAVTE
jgi:hypothetical protein